MIRGPVLVTILVAGCYTRPVYTLVPAEQCASNSMVISDTSNAGLYGTSQSVAPGSNGGLYGATSREAPGDQGGLYGASTREGSSGGLYGASMRNNQQTLQCRPPATAEDRCEVQAFTASIRLKHDANANGEQLTDAEIDAARQDAHDRCIGRAR